MSLVPDPMSCKQDAFHLLCFNRCCQGLLLQRGLPWSLLLHYGQRRNGTQLWSWGPLLVCYISLWNCPGFSIWPGRLVFLFSPCFSQNVFVELHSLLYWVRHFRGLRSYTFSFVSEFVARLRLRTHWSWIQDLSNSLYFLLMPLWMESKVRCRSAPTEPWRSRSICAEGNSICPAWRNLFVSTTRRKNSLSQNTISFLDHIGHQSGLWVCHRCWLRSCEGQGLWDTEAWYFSCHKWEMCGPAGVKGRSLLFIRVFGLHCFSYTYLRKIINITKIVRFTMRKSGIRDFWTRSSEIIFFWKIFSLFTRFSNYTALSGT